MAAPACMSDDGQQAVFVGTFLANGDAVALCENCLPAFTASVTADMFGVDGQQLLTWLQENAGEEAPGDETTAAELAAPPAMLPDPTPAGAGDQAAPESTGDAPEDAGGSEQAESPPASDQETAAGE